MTQFYKQDELLQHFHRVCADRLLNTLEGGNYALLFTTVSELHIVRSKQELDSELRLTRCRCWYAVPMLLLRQSNKKLHDLIGDKRYVHYPHRSSERTLTINHK